MIGILTLGAIALGLVGARKQQAGIGRVKRRIYRELADAQDHGIDFNAVFGWGGTESMLRSLVDKYGYKGSKKSTKPIEEQYFNSLKRAYNAISGIGSTSLPYHKSEVTNKYGDVVLAYYDYGTEDDMWNAARDFWRNSGEFNGFTRTVQYIAEGGKFLWSGGGEKGAIKKGVKEECFSTRTDASGERKKRLSYLSKQGITPAAFAERIWGEGYETEINRSPDDMEIRDGVIDAILQIENAGQARQMIMDFYIVSHTDPEIPMRDREEADPLYLGVFGIGSTWGVEDYDDEADESGQIHVTLERSTYGGHAIDESEWVIVPVKDYGEAWEVNATCIASDDRKYPVGMDIDFELYKDADIWDLEYTLQEELENEY